jgi:hypothetical protein
VSYPGDSTHSGSSATFSVMVGSIWATGGITLSANNLTLSANGNGSTQMTITPTGGYNGALTWSSSYTGGTASQTICYYVATPPTVAGTTAATLHIGVGTACSSPAGGHLVQGSPIQRTAMDRPSSRLLRSVSGTAATPVLAVLLFGLLPQRRRKLLPVLAALLVSTLPIALSGCGGGSGSGGTDGTNVTGGSGGTTTSKAQVYTVTMTAKDSVLPSITASTSFTVTVN